MLLLARNKALVCADYKISMGPDQPALIAALVAVNNQNLHKLFKEMDSSARAHRSAHWLLKLMIPQIMMV